MSISPALDIARRALIAQETALSVTGQNIANVDTPGFTRQAPQFVSDPGVPTAGGVIIGGGVRISTVTQLIDPLLSRQRLASETSLGEQTVKRDQLQNLSSLLNDLSQPSLTGALDGFFNAADGLARNPSGLAERQTLLGSATAVATELNQQSTGLATQQRAVDNQVLSLVKDANDALTQIATLNRTIVADEIGGQPANDLRDERQQLLNSLAGKLGITSIEDDRGAVTVSSTAGPVLVAGDAVVHPLATQAGAVGLDGSVLHDVGLAGAGGTFLAVPAILGQGAVAGLLDVRDTALATASTNLDTVANALRDAVNFIQTDPAARDLDNTATTAVPFFASTGAADFRVAIADPRKIAAALSSQPGDNQNALRLADLRSSAPETLTSVAAVPIASAAATAIGNVSFSQFLAAELGRIGGDAAQASDIATAAQNLNTSLENQRAALSGVNLNEELTNLLKYQRSFQAAAQLLNVTNGMLDTLLQIVP